MKKNDINKVIVWRIISICLLFTMTYLYLGELSSSVELVVIVNVVMTIVHYFFEGWWRNLSIGRESY